MVRTKPQRKKLLSRLQTMQVNTMEKVIIFTLNGEYYGLSVMTVKEVVKFVDLIPVPGSNDFVDGVMNLRGKVIPVVNLEKKFQLAQAKSEHFEHIIVVEINNLSFGVLVNEVVEVLSISPESIQPVSETLSKKIDANLLKGIIVDSKGKAKETHDGDERLILYLNPDTIFTERQSQVVANITEEVKK